MWRAWGFVKGHRKECISESLLREQEMATWTMHVGPSSMQFVPHKIMIRPTQSLVGFTDIELELTNSPTSDKQRFRLSVIRNIVSNLEHSRLSRKRALLQAQYLVRSGSTRPEVLRLDNFHNPFGMLGGVQSAVARSCRKLSLHVMSCRPRHILATPVLCSPP
jgi:hypothetical protein